MTAPQPGCYPLVDVARVLHVSLDTVRREIRRGKLTAFRVGRVWRVDVREVVRYRAANDRQPSMQK